MKDVAEEVGLQICNRALSATTAYILKFEFWISQFIFKMINTVYDFAHKGLLKKVKDEVLANPQLINSVDSVCFILFRPKIL